VITDAGSVKSTFIDDALAVFGNLARVVPGHPIAGREKTGIDAMDASLFESRRVLLTPVEQSEPQAIAAVTALWELAGASVENLTPEHHEIFRYAAGGFRDFSRIASSDPVMWRDVCLSNPTAILRSMDSLDEHIKVLRAAIAASDGQRIEEIFIRAKAARDRFT